MRIIFVSPEKIRSLLSGLLLITMFLYIFGHFFGNAWKAHGGIKELRVLIDPGHGGVDGGTRDSQGNLEKQINLQVSLRLREHLRQSGLQVFITRETDMDLNSFGLLKQGRHRRDLIARIRIARENQCLFLVSLHCDWSKNPQKRGAQVFFYQQSPSGKRLADLIQMELNILQHNNRKALPGEFFIIKQQGVTGVIVEMGMLSNQSEAELLQNSNFQEQLALAIAKGVLKFCHIYFPAELPAYDNLIDLEQLE